MAETAPATATATSTAPHAAPANAPGKEEEVNPKEFQGEVTTNNELPSIETQRKIDEFLVLDQDGKSHTFKSLYIGEGVARRVLIVFVRHFYCGNCQEYIRTLSASFPPPTLLSLPIPTSLVVIGCGDPALIPMYIEATDCPFTCYTDPTRKLYSELRMIETLKMGDKAPEYMKKSMWSGAVSSIWQGLKQIPKGLALKSGNTKQVGGEFLWEPVDGQGGVVTPGGVRDGEGEEKKLTWCHRMRNTRDHAEVKELRRVLGMPEEETVPASADTTGPAAKA